MATPRLAAVLCLSVSVSIVAGACSSSSDGSKALSSEGAGGKAAAPPDAAPDEKGEKDDLEPAASDFTCILDGTKVEAFYMKNRYGSLGNAEDVATSADGGKYPVGTMIQLIPTEAMVKRYAGYSPDTNDWEFFSLTVSATGTEITASGTTQVLNAFNLNCLDCHRKADPKFDFVCGKTHGCDPLPFTDDQISGIQAADARCTK